MTYSKYQVYMSGTENIIHLCVYRASMISHLNFPHLPLQAALPHIVWQHYLQPFGSLVKLPYHKNKAETCMVDEPSYVK